MLNYLDLIGKVTNVPKTELIAKLTKNGEGTELIEETEAKAYIETILSNKINTVGTDNLKRGKREGLSNLEKSIREKFNFTSTAQGIDLIESVVSNQLETLKAGLKPEQSESGDEITIEKIKSLPIYQTLVDEIKNPFETRYSELETEYNNFKTDHLTNQKKSVAYKLATEILDRHKAILGEGDARNKRLNFFNNSIPLERIQLSEVDGKPNIVILDSNGNKMVDKYQTPITYEQFIKDLNPYGFHKHDPDRTGTGGDGGIGGGTGGSGSKWKNDGEFMTYINDPKLTPDQRNAALKEFQESKKKE